MVGHPQPVAAGVESGDEVGKLPADLGFETGVKAPVRVVVDGMDLGDSAHHPGVITVKDSLPHYG